MKLRNIMLSVTAAVMLVGCGKDVGNDPDPTPSKSGHPVLLISSGDEALIERMVDSNAKMKLVQRKVYAQANAAVKSGPSSYMLNGKRLLDVSRKSLQNLFSLSYAYRMSKGEQYLKAAVAELDAVCAFPDWHPSHYLDVAELCMGVAIAYDWLYDWLPADTRAAAEKAIEEYALKTGLNTNFSKSFLNSSGNWNQVCSAGLFYGAMAIKDKSPELSRRVLEMCRSSIRAAVDAYGPDGAYAEGPGYWSYGTDFNIMLAYADKKMGGTPYISEGFRKTPYYFLHSVAPSGRKYNYSDCDDSVNLDIAQFYFSGLTGDNSLLWWDWKKIGENMSDNRLLPAVLVFAKDLSLENVKVPADRYWTGGGKTPVYFTRTSWNGADASYMGIKGGRAQDSHSHMDAGSFIFEADGVRWGIDYGNENYTNVENAGVSLWDMTQGSARWNLLAYNNKQHNTITLGGKNMLVSGFAGISGLIDGDGENGATFDLTRCYDGVSKVTRTATLADDGTMTTVDRIVAYEETEYRWTMISDINTTSEIQSASSVLLSRNGKRLLLTVSVEPSGITVSPASASFAASNSYEGVKGLRTTFNASVPSGSETKFTVTLKPVK